MSIEEEIEAINARIRPLCALRDELARKKRDQDSHRYILANQITKDEIEPSSGEGRPWFGDVYQFGKWLKEASNKPWAEWNGRIYRSSDLILGRMPDSPALMEHAQ